MEHLSNENIANYINGKYAYQELIKISAHIINCEEICLKKLNEIDPNFLKLADEMEAERERIIKGKNHFSEAEIEKYINKQIDLEQRLKMHSHFTKCPLCAEKLKFGNPEYLTDFIKDTLAGNKKKGSIEIMSETNESWLRFNLLVPASLLMIFVISIFSFWFFSGKREVDQVKIDASGYQNQVTNKNPLKISDNENTSNGNENENTSKESNNREATETNKPLRQTRLVEKQIIQEKIVKKNQKETTNKKTELIVTNRSLGNNCETLPILAISPNNVVITVNQPTLTWKQVKKTVSYQIYLADTQNNLIEESKIENSNNSYKVKNILELNKKYEWKVVATLDDGKEIYGESAIFSIGLKAGKLSNLYKKQKVNQTRCVTTPKK